jgi:exonuclease 3'-5' domain-containing protein 1
MTMENYKKPWDDPGEAKNREWYDSMPPNEDEENGDEVEGFLEVHNDDPPYVERDDIGDTLPELPWNFKTLGPNDNTSSIPVEDWKTLVPLQTIVLVDNMKELREFLKNVANLKRYKKWNQQALAIEWFIDLEGYPHGWHGNLGLVQTTFASLPGVSYLLDPIALSDELFTTTGPDKFFTLKDYLEDPEIPKGLWDCREDNRAFVGQRKIQMKGVIDMQLMELATRHAGGRGFVKGLYNATSDLRLTNAERYAWQQKKKAGGSFEGTWTKRPLPEMLIDYAAGDTIYLPHLYAVYLEKLRPYPELQHLVLAGSERRIGESSRKTYESSRHYAPQQFKNCELSIPTPGMCQVGNDQYCRVNHEDDEYSPVLAPLTDQELVWRTWETRGTNSGSGTFLQRPVSSHDLESPRTSSSNLLSRSSSYSNFTYHLELSLNDDVDKLHVEDDKAEDDQYYYENDDDNTYFDNSNDPANLCSALDPPQDEDDETVETVSFDSSDETLVENSE